MSTSNPTASEGPRHPGVAILQLAVVIIAPSTGALCALWIWPGAVGAGLYALCKGLLYGIPLIILCQNPGLRKLPRWLLGGTGRTGILVGILSGFAIWGIIWALWAFALESRTDASSLVEVMIQNGMRDPFKFWVFAIWLCVVNSLLEEVVFRWYVDSRLESFGMSSGLLLAVSAAIFTAHHVIVLSAYFSWPLVVLGSAGVFCGGALWSILRRRYHGLLPGWVSHALVDVAVVLIGWSILVTTTAAA